MYGLSPSAGALLLAAPGLATLAVSMPAGILADRLGARRVTIIATFLMSAGALAQAAPSYMILIGGRLLFGGVRDRVDHGRRLAVGLAR
jgi:MFS family permease